MEDHNVRAANLRLPLVTALIITWNRMAELRECLRSLVAQDYPDVEITVVDNGSTDGTPEMVRREFPGVHLSLLGGNLGAGARAAASAEARGKYLFYIDDDASAEAPVIGALVARVERDPQLAVVTPRRVDYDPDAPRPVLEPLPPVRCLGLFSSCAVLLRAAALREIGGFPADHAYGAAETDLAVRFAAQGWRMEAFHDVVIWHKRTAVARDERREFRLVYRNTVRSLWRRAPLGRALAGTVYAVAAYGQQGLRRGYGLTHLGVTLGLPAAVARILLRGERCPVCRDAYDLMDYLEDHWVSSWDEVDPVAVRRYGNLCRAIARRLAGRKAVSRI